MAYEFKIGTTFGGKVTLASLGIKDPLWEFVPYSKTFDLGDGTQRGGGWPVTIWHWGFLPSAKRDVLKAYCPGASAIIHITTPNNALANIGYQAIMVWPARETKVAGRVLDISIMFRGLA
jgi:hypothetical protein